MSRVFKNLVILANKKLASNKARKSSVLGPFHVAVLQGQSGTQLPANPSILEGANFFCCRKFSKQHVASDTQENLQTLGSGPPLVAVRVGRAA